METEDFVLAVYSTNVALNFHDNAERCALNLVYITLLGLVIIEMTQTIVVYVH